MIDKFSKLHAWIVISILICGSNLVANGSSSEKPQKGTGEVAE